MVAWACARVAPSTGGAASSSVSRRLCCRGQWTFRETTAGTSVCCPIESAGDSVLWGGVQRRDRVSTPAGVRWSAVPLWPDGASAATAGSDTVSDTGSDTVSDPPSDSATRLPLTLLRPRRLVPPPRQAPMATTAPSHPPVAAHQRRSPKTNRSGRHMRTAPPLPRAAADLRPTRSGTSLLPTATGTPVQLRRRRRFRH